MIGGSGSRVWAARAGGACCLLARCLLALAAAHRLSIPTARGRSDPGTEGTGGGDGESYHLWGGAMLPDELDSKLTLGDGEAWGAERVAGCPRGFFCLFGVGMCCLLPAAVGGGTLAPLHPSPRVKPQILGHLQSAP